MITMADDRGSQNFFVPQGSQPDSDRIADATQCPSLGTETEVLRTPQASIRHEAVSLQGGMQTGRSKVIQVLPEVDRSFQRSALDGGLKRFGGQCTAHVGNVDGQQRVLRRSGGEKLQGFLRVGKVLQYIEAKDHIKRTVPPNLFYVARRA